jgi:hypothetical protein
MKIERSPYPGNKTFTRWWTARELDRARAELGDEHPDTLEAAREARDAWGPGRSWFPVAHEPVEAREVGKPDRRESDERAFGDVGRRVTDSLAAIMKRAGARRVGEEG